MKKTDWAKDVDREPDWDEWKRVSKAQLPLWQAVALSLNVNPDDVGRKHPNRYQPGFPMFDESPEFDKRLRVLIANISDPKQFPTKPDYEEAPWCSGIRLDEFAAWMLHEMKWEIPPQLADMASTKLSAPSESVYRHTEYLPYSVIEAELEKDEAIRDLASKVLAVVSKGSTYTMATYVSGLLAHWTAHKDLPCYLNGKPIDVTSADIQVSGTKVLMPISF